MWKQTSEWKNTNNFEYVTHDNVKYALQCLRNTTTHSIVTEHTIYFIFVGLFCTILSLRMNNRMDDSKHTLFLFFVHIEKINNRNMLWSWFVINFSLIQNTQKCFLGAFLFLNNYFRPSKHPCRKAKDKQNAERMNLTFVFILKYDKTKYK